MLLEGLNLFPLSRLESSLTSYFMDAESYQVYSNRSGKLVKIFGSSTPSGQYYKFVRTSLGRATYSYPITYRRDELIAQATKHRDFKTETSSEPLRKLEVSTAVPANTVHAKTIDEGIKSRGYVIGQVNDQAIIFGSKPAIHLTEESANREMERLALKKPGTKFVRLHIERALTMGTVIWE